MKIEDYAAFEPTFNLYAYFQGDTRGWGMFQDRGGTLKRQFVVDIKGEVTQDGELVLTEDFVWNDGEKSQRIWYIRKQDAHHYSGKAADVVGEASGKAYGNALNWQYDLKLPVDGKVWQVTRVPSAAFAQVYFGIWLGEKQPIAQELREALLQGLP